MTNEELRELLKLDAKEEHKRLAQLPGKLLRRRWTEDDYELEDDLLRDLPGSGDDPFFDDVFKR